MTDIIKTIGSSGADYATWQAWFAARTGAAGDRYIGEIITTGGGLSSGSAATGEYAGELIIRAAAGLEWDPENPSAPHATITAASSFNLTTSSILKFENVEVRNTAASPTTALINTGTGVAKTTVRNCWLRGGRYGVINNIAGSTLLVENSLITETARIGVYNFVAGATIRNTVIANCSTEAGTSSSYGGVRKDQAGTVLENVVCFNNGNVDFFGATTAATVSYLASEDVTATGVGALTGVTSAAFTDYANNIFTAATGGALDGTGPSGNDRGLVLAGAPAIYITTPVVWDLYARNPATNTGSISITGTYSDATPTAIEARWSGAAWVTIDAAPTGGSYSGSLTGLAAGNGALEVRMANATSVTTSVDNVAIGAKFLFWGQSNFSGRATNAQTYTGTAGWFHKYTVTNNQWQQGADPFDTATASGSIYPLLANLLTTELGCPVGFIGVAMGSTALAAWQPGQTLNNRMVDYCNAATAHGSGGIEAVISWIGESDADAGTAEADFKSRYNTVIDQLKALTGKNSLLVATSGLDTVGYTNVRQWVSDIAATSANTAPEEVQMWPLFQKVHYETDIETALAADAVFDGMMAWFYASLSVVLSGNLTPGATITATLVNYPSLPTSVTITDSRGNDIVRPLTATGSTTATFTVPALASSNAGQDYIQFGAVNLTFGAKTISSTFNTVSPLVYVNLLAPVATNAFEAWGSDVPVANEQLTSEGNFDVNGNFTGADPDATYTCWITRLDGTNHRFTIQQGTVEPTPDLTTAFIRPIVRPLIRSIIRPMLQQSNEV